MDRCCTTRLQYIKHGTRDRQKWRIAIREELLCAPDDDNDDDDVTEVKVYKISHTRTCILPKHCDLVQLLVGAYYLLLCLILFINSSRNTCYQ